MRAPVPNPCYSWCLAIVYPDEISARVRAPWKAQDLNSFKGGYRTGTVAPTVQADAP